MSYFIELVKDRLGLHFEDRECNTLAHYIVQDFSLNTIDSSQAIIIIEQVTRRLLADEPYQYILGYTNFYGYKFAVNANVLIPRPETEELIRIMCDMLLNDQPSTILDIGTGSGVIPITLQKSGIKSEIHGLDVSFEALAVARENAAFHSSHILWHHQNFLDESLWDTLPFFDCIVSNPPYIGLDEAPTMGRNVRHYEPHIALFVEGDPLLFYRAIGYFITKQNVRGVHFFGEINPLYAHQINQLFEMLDFSRTTIFDDMQGKARIVHSVF